MSHSRSLSLIFSVLILLTLIIVSAVNVSRVSAATIVVNSFEDNEIDDNACTLREAIIAANTDAPYRGCPAGNGTDTLTLLAGTYTLTSQLPNITSEITINGSGASTTILQASSCSPVTSVTPGGCTTASYRLLQIDALGYLRLNNMTIRHGNINNLGGALLNYGTSIITAVHFTENAAAGGGALANISGILTLFNSNVQNNKAADPSTGGGWGGGIYNYNGTVTIVDGMLSENLSSIYAGGAYNYQGTMIISYTTIADNNARFGGGFFNTDNSLLTVVNNTISKNWVEEEGGGIYNNGALILKNSTISGNTAKSGGGIFGNAGSLSLESNTISENIAQYYGGLLSYGSLSFSNTIIANSVNGDCKIDFGGSIGTNYHNLVEDGSCNVNAAYFISEDPMLGPLGYNGGPTQTHALLVNSPAIDAGNCAFSPETDQRGEPRPIGSACDIGAFEFNPAKDGYQFIFLPLIMR
jgi:CSLREA domain-containing protein